MKKKVTPQNEANASPKPLAKIIPMKSCPLKNILLAEDAIPPSLSDITKMQAMQVQMDNMPDKNEPIVLSDTWYEYSVFRSKFNLSIGTANKWLANGWLPFSLLGKMRFINKTDIENMMLRFRRYGLLWAGWLLPFANEWEALCL